MLHHPPHLQHRRHPRREAGRVTGSLLLLLVIASGLGAWNYHRNWTIEKQSAGHRPYESYATTDIEALRSAYQSEIGGAEAQFNDAKRQRVRPQRDVGSIAENVDQFQKTSQTSQRIRKAASNLADQQGQIAELDRELELRAQLGVGVMRHVKRLVAI